MLTTTKNVQTKLPSLENTSILLVSPYSDDQPELDRILNQSGCNMTRCSTASDAMTQLHQNAADVVVCESHLPDGTWKTMLAACEALPNSPNLLVVSRQADESLWAEVLNLGGYDVLLKPFDRSEVIRVLGAASAPPLPKPINTKTTSAQFNS